MLQPYVQVSRQRGIDPTVLGLSPNIHSFLAHTHSLHQNHRSSPPNCNINNFENMLEAPHLTFLSRELLFVCSDGVSWSSRQHPPGPSIQTISFSHLSPSSLPLTSNLFFQKWPRRVLFDSFGWIVEKNSQLLAPHALCSWLPTDLVPVGSGGIVTHQLLHTHTCTGRDRQKNHSNCSTHVS
jgi:hypothetical protein